MPKTIDIERRTEEGMKEEYSAERLQVLEGLEAVRVRPGMYIGTTGSKGMHHILWEIVDNSIDEVANGYGEKIDITIHKDNSITVRDDGRGVPPDIHKEYGISGIELIFTKLHAGGKFGNDNYTFSGGLHGVGASVTNALSKWLTVEVYKGGVKYTQKFRSYTDEKGKMKCGEAYGGLLKEPCGSKERGTGVTFLPDEEVFKKEKFSFDIINRRIRELAFLNSMLIVTLTDEREVEPDGEFKSVRYHFGGGLCDFVKYLDSNKTCIYADPIYIVKEKPKFRLELAIQHTDGYNENICSYVNNIPTPEGGTHETGFKVAYTKVLNDYGRQKGYIKDKQANFDGEDFREGMTAVLSIKMQNVQFEGQTKTKLGNPEIRTEVDSIVSECLFEYLVKAKKELLDKLYDKAGQAARARESAVKAKQLSRQKNQVSNNTLVGKLSACTGRDYSKNEIFIVEGDSAGGTAKQGRDRSFQAILPLRGKPLNAEKKRITEILANEEIISIINALGAGFDDSFKEENLKYDKVIILADADQDGAHIRAILLTFFYRYMKDLVSQGHVYIGMPPLYKITTKTKTVYAYDDDELREVIKEVGSRYELQRFKGLGEMSAEQLWETTMSPESRTMMRVTIDDVAEADRMISTLMGDNIEARKSYINENANFNKVDTFEEIGG